MAYHPSNLTEYFVVLWTERYDRYCSEKDAYGLWGFIREVFTEHGAADENLFQAWVKEELDAMEINAFPMFRDCLIASLDYDQWADEVEDYVENNPYGDTPAAKAERREQQRHRNHTAILNLLAETDPVKPAARPVVVASE